MRVIPFAEKGNGKEQGRVAEASSAASIKFISLKHTHTSEVLCSDLIKLCYGSMDFYYILFSILVCMFEIYFIIKYIFLNHPSTRVFLRGITKARKIKHTVQLLSL